MSDAERREISYQNLDEAIADAERLAESETRVTGNHSFGQILEHLALSVDASTGQAEVPKPPLYMKIMMPLMKRMVINAKPLAPGVKLPPAGEAFFWPDREFDVPAALQHLKDSVAFYQSKGPLPKHPFFGALTREQNDQLHCRHCALHLSFVHPA